MESNGGVLYAKRELCRTAYYPRNNLRLINCLQKFLDKKIELFADLAAIDDHVDEKLQASYLPGCGHIFLILDGIHINFLTGITLLN